MRSHLNAPSGIGLFEIAEMEPGIGTIFNPSLDRQGGMHSTVIFAAGKFIQDTGPKNRTTNFRGDGDVQFVKVGTTTGFDVIQIEIKGQNARSLFSDEIVFWCWGQKPKGCKSEEMQQG